MNDLISVGTLALVAERFGTHENHSLRHQSDKYHIAS